MKREGRQHGMVRTHPILSAPWNPRPKPKTPNQLGSPPTAGLFNRVSSKPTNHSKFTGKCGRPKCRECHIHPASKSKDKVKGALKIKSASDVTSNNRLITWRVVDARPNQKFVGFSATGILDYLSSADYMNQDYDYNDDDDVQNYSYEISYDKVEIDNEDDDYGINDDRIEEMVQNNGDYSANYDNNDHCDNDKIEEIGEIDGDYSVSYDDNDGDDDDDDDEDEKMSFCEVGFVWQPVDGDDSWFLVEEM